MIDFISVQSAVQISQVAQLAREIWQEHYVPIIGRAQVDYMLDQFQSENAIADQIAAGYEYYIVVQEQQNMGYVAVFANRDNAVLKLSKIYVKKTARGRGLGRKMMAFTENLCRKRQIRKIWLAVNKNNDASIAWYQGMGFTVTESTVQDIGNGFVMDDYRMEKNVPPSTGTP